MGMGMGLDGSTPPPCSCPIYTAMAPRTDFRRIALHILFN